MKDLNQIVFFMKLSIILKFYGQILFKKIFTLDYILDFLECVS